MERPAQQDAYHVNHRLDVLPYAPRDVSSVLDVGCAAGGFCESLRRVLAPGARVVGVEAVATAAADARAAGAFDEVIDGYFPEALAGRDDTFDLVVFLDVLEHMLDPGEALDAAHERLAPGGRVLASIPNIGYAPVVADLVRGRWDYTDTGVLDRTHVRFFTAATMRELFTAHGYAVQTCAGINDVAEVWNSDPLLPRRWVQKAMRRALGSAAYMQFVIVARSERAG